MNTTIHLGNIGKDPELRRTANGKAVCEISIAVRNPSDDDSPDWFQVVTWGTTAERVAEFKRKGDEILVEGHLKTDSYDKDGTTHRTVKIHAEQVTFLRNVARTD